LIAARHELAISTMSPTAEFADRSAWMVGGWRKTKPAGLPRLYAGGNQDFGLDRTDPNVQAEQRQVQDRDAAGDHRSAKAAERKSGTQHRDLSRQEPQLPSHWVFVEDKLIAQLDAAVEQQVGARLCQSFERAASRRSRQGSADSACCSLSKATTSDLKTGQITSKMPVAASTAKSATPGSSPDGTPAGFAEIRLRRWIRSVEAVRRASQGSAGRDRRLVLIQWRRNDRLRDARLTSDCWWPMRRRPALRARLYLRTRNDACVRLSRDPQGVPAVLPTGR